LSPEWRGVKPPQTKASLSTRKHFDPKLWPAAGEEEARPRVRESEQHHPKIAPRATENSNR